MIPRELGSNGWKIRGYGKDATWLYLPVTSLVKSRRDNFEDREHTLAQEFDFKQFYKLRIGGTSSVSNFSVLCCAPYRKGQTTTTGTRNKELVSMLADHLLLKKQISTHTNSCLHWSTPLHLVGSTGKYCQQYFTVLFCKGPLQKP